MEYFNYSGGAKGADLAWDQIGGQYGFTNHKHFRPSDLKNATEDIKQRIERDVKQAAISLGRPTSEFPGKDFVRRNWFQQWNAEAIFAISRIINPGDIDKGFVNNTGKAHVAGGTAWACEMGFQDFKYVYVFDMNVNQWFMMIYEDPQFEQIETPILTQHYAGIGSRELTAEGIQAIHNVYKKTLGI